MTTSARRSCESAVERRRSPRVGDHRHRGRQRHGREPARLVADRVGLDAAEPDRDHRAEPLVVADADADVDAGRRHPLHHHRRGVVAEVLAHRGDALGSTSVGVGEVERDARLRGAADPPVRGLHRHREADARSRSPPPRPASPPVTVRVSGIVTPYAGEQLADDLRRARSARFAASGLGDRARRRRRRRCGRAPARGRSSSAPSVRRQSAYAAIRPSTAAACSGNENDGTDEPGSSGPSPDPSITATTGLVAPAHAASICVARLADRVDQRRRVDHEHRVDAGVVRARPARRRGSRRRCCANPSRRGGSTASSPTASSVALASTPGLVELVTTATRRPLDQRLRREHAGRVEHRRHRRHLDHAGVAVHRLVAGADQRRAGADRDDRPRPRHPAGDAGELARVAERLGVDRDHLRRLVVLPELQQVVARHVGLVAERHEPRDRQLELCGEPQQGDAERARLHRDRHVARGAAARRRATPAARRRRSGEAMPIEPGPMIRSPDRRAWATIAADVDLVAERRRRW